MSPTTIREIKGLTYADSPLALISKPELKTITLSSLQGLADYIASGEISRIWPSQPLDGGDLGKDIFIQVISSQTVRVVGPIRDDNGRDCPVAAVFTQSTKFPFGSWVIPEEFIVQFKTNVVAPMDTGIIPGVPVDGAPVVVSHYHQLLALASSIASEHINTLKDDGVSQSVATRQGINVDMTRILPFYELNFRRTFPEIYQPRSSFFLRIRTRNDGKNIELCLHECTHDEWEMTARDRIKKWLQEHIKSDQAVFLD
jgi:hypothetical protein